MSQQNFPAEMPETFELMQLALNAAKIGRWMRRYVRATAFQGALQVAIIVVMARFVSGL